MQISTIGRSLAVLTVLTVITGFALWVLYLSDNKIFSPYISNLHPLTAILIVSIPGIISLYILEVRGWFHIFKRGQLIPGILFSLIITPIFSLLAISLDLVFRFSGDINILFPQSILFYPGIAYVVELVFHAIPLAALLLITSIFFRSSRGQSQLYLCIFLVSLIEPLYQLDFSVIETSGYLFQTLLIIHLLMFNLMQMYIYKRFDFISMFLFRIIFYLQWHVIWGELRLVLLF